MPVSVAPGPVERLPSERSVRRAALVEAAGRGELRRILAVRFNRIGDIVFTTPALEALAEALPEARIDYLTGPAGRALVAGHPAVHEVLCFQPGAYRPGYLLRRSALARAIRARDYDLLLIFESDRPTRDMLERLARRAGVRHVVSRSSFVRGPDDAGATHSCEKHLRLLGMLGLSPAPRPYRIHAGAEEDTRIGAWLGARGVTGGPGEAPLVAVQAGCHYSRVPAWLLRRIGLRHKFHKTWPEARWSEVGSLLSERLGARVVLTGSAAERRLAERVARGIQAPLERRPLVAAGDTSVGELVALLRRSRLLLSIDTGTLHVAAALGVPSVALFGPTDPAHHGPYGAPGITRVLRSGIECSPCKKPARRACRLNRCLLEIRPEQVVEAARGFLEGAAPR